MQIRFDITREDVLAFYRRALSDDPRWKQGWKQFKQQRLFAIGAALGASVIWLVFMRDYYDGRRASPTNPMFWLGVLTLYLWWAAVGAMRWDQDKYIEQNARSYIAGPEVRYSEGPHEVALSPERLVFRGPHHTLEMVWTAVFRILDEPAHVFIQRRDGSGLIIPKRCLRDADHAREFLALARGLHANAGADIGSRLAVFLADRDVKCDSCGYNLRGTSTGVCPECAADLSPILVRLGGSL